MYSTLVARVKELCQFPNEAESRRIISGLKWIGLFTNEPATVRDGTLLDTLCARLEVLMKYEDGERDLVMLQHKFIVEWADGTTDTITSTLEAYGEPQGHSAMALYVGVPCGIAVQLVLDGVFKTPGIIAPYSKEICDPAAGHGAHREGALSGAACWIQVIPGRARRERASGAHVSPGRGRRTRSTSKSLRDGIGARGRRSCLKTRMYREERRRMRILWVCTALWGLSQCGASPAALCPCTGSVVARRASSLAADSSRRDLSLGANDVAFHSQGPGLYGVLDCLVPTPPFSRPVHRLGSKCSAPLCFTKVRKTMTFTCSSAHSAHR